jgi:large subunit ribosomal protein L34
MVFGHAIRNFVRMAAAMAQLAHAIVSARTSELMKRTHQPKKRQRVKVHGFRARMASAGGVKVIKARRRKGRRRLTPTSSRRAR